MANPIIAAILSFFIPGLGQLLSKKILKGILFFILLFIINYLLWILMPITMGISSYFAILYNVYVAYDAYHLNN